MQLNKIKRKAPKSITFGPLGTGKTLFWQTGGECVHIVDCDDGSQSGLYWKDKWSAERELVDVKRFVEPDPDVVSGFIRVRTHLLDIARKVKSGTWPYPVVVIDSLTSLVEMAVRQTMYNSGRLVNGKIDTVRIQDWGNAFVEVTNLLCHAKSMDVAVVLIAHQTIIEEGASKKITIACRGKNLPNEIPRLFDEVWYHRKEDLSGGKLKIKIITKPTEMLDIRSRANLPAEFSVGVGAEVVLKKMKFDMRGRKEVWKKKQEKKEAAKLKKEKSNSSPKPEAEDKPKTSSTANAKN